MRTRGSSARSPGRALPLLLQGSRCRSEGGCPGRPGTLRGEGALTGARRPALGRGGTPSQEELAGLEEGMGALPSTELAVRNLWMSDFFLPGLGAESDVIVTGAGALWRLGEELAIEESAEGLKAAARARGEREEREDVLFDLGESRDIRFEAGLSLGITGS